MSEIKARSAADYGMRLSESAVRRVRALAAAEGAPLKLRVAVMGGGCAGFQYSFVLDDTETQDDLVLERDGAVVVVDEISAALLQGSEIDWVERLEGSAFIIHNPNATSSCGCGTSFAIG